MKKSLWVQVRLMVPADQMHDDDAGLPGTYEVLVNAELPREAMATVALDLFHDHQGIEVLDDFEIVVVDPVTREILEETDVDVDEELATGEYVGKISDRLLFDNED